MKDSKVPPRDGDEDEGASIINLDEVRQRRRQQAAEEGDAAELEALRQRHAMQLGVLQDLLHEERLEPGDLMDMIKLGIITDDEDLLPCDSRSRREDFFAWEEEYYADPGLRSGPDEDLTEELKERLQAHDPEVAERFSIDSRKRAPDPNEVVCPLLAYRYPDFPPPCVVAIRSRGEPEFDLDTGKVTIHHQPYDEDDPVVAADLHPCVVLGRELYKAIMLPVWRRKDEEGDDGAPGDDGDDED